MHCDGVRLGSAILGRVPFRTKLRPVGYAEAHVEELRILPDFGSGQPTVEDRVSCRVSAQALFIVLAAVRVLYEFWRKKVLDIFL